MRYTLGIVIDQVVCEKTIGASYGDAFLAAMAVGHATRADITRWNPVATTVVAEPNPLYDKHHTLYLRLYEQTKDIARELSPDS